jgi:hypothetical protein
VSCSCDYEGPEFISAKEVTAKIINTCSECGREIQIGEQYERVTGKWEGRFDTFRTCLKCQDLRDSLAAANGGCFAYGGLWEDYQYYLQEHVRGDVDTFEIYTNALMRHRSNQLTNQEK